MGNSFKGILYGIAAAAGFAALAGCAVPEGGPGQYAGQTVLDEKAAIAAETAYTAAATAASIAIEAGAVTDPATIAMIGEIDRRAYQAVLASRAAYDAGNAEGYAEALTEADRAVRQIIELL